MNCYDHVILQRYVHVILKCVNRTITSSVSELVNVLMHWREAESSSDPMHVSFRCTQSEACLTWATGTTEKKTEWKT